MSEQNHRGRVERGDLWRAAFFTVLALEAVAVAVWLLPATIRIAAWPASGPSRVALFAAQYRLMALGLEPVMYFRLYWPEVFGTRRDAPASGASPNRVSERCQ